MVKNLPAMQETLVQSRIRKIPWRKKWQPIPEFLPFKLQYPSFSHSLVAQRLKRLPGMRETRVQSLGQEDPLEKEMATHSSTLGWRIPWREEPGILQSMGSQRVGHDWANSLSLSPIFQTLNVTSMKLTDLSPKSTSLSSAAVKKIFWGQDLLMDWVGKLCKGKLNSGSVTWANVWNVYLWGCGRLVETSFRGKLNSGISKMGEMQLVANINPS